MTIGLSVKYSACTGSCFSKHRVVSKSYIFRDSSKSSEFHLQNAGPSFHAIPVAIVDVLGDRSNGHFASLEICNLLLTIAIGQS